MSTTYTNITYTEWTEFKLIELDKEYFDSMFKHFMICKKRIVFKEETQLPFDCLKRSHIYGGNVMIHLNVRTIIAT